MLDIKFIRENPQIVQKASKDKGVDVNINHLLELDKKYRELFLSVQKLREERNRFARLQSPHGEASGGQAKERNIEDGKKVKGELEEKEKALRTAEEELKEQLFKIPNLPKKDVKAGKDESENEILRKVGEVRKFDFKVKDHLELGRKLDIIDTERAAKVSGARFTYHKNEAALLEFALIRLAFETLIKENFVPIIPPVLIRKEVMRELGYMEHGADEDVFLIPKDDLVLVGTAEHAIVSMHKDEVFNEKDLPKRYVGFSSAFRREAGSYGKDTRGILRVHQFDKVEMVSLVKEGADDKEHEFLLSMEEKLFQLLEIPYQVVKMCTGDLGFPAARKYDLEAWIPSQDKYREVTSTSTTTDFQARRLNIKYSPRGEAGQDSNQKKYVHILNGTAFAVGRTLIAILENYQQKDGSVLIPKVLQNYTDFSKILPKNSKK